MELFPIGTISQGSSTGTIDSVSYTMFEPNLKTMSQPIYTVLTTKFEDQTMLTRKQAEPYLVLSYEYENIFDREYRQIEHFVDSKEGNLTSFFTPDFSQGYKPSNVASVSSDWRVYISNTRLYSSTANQKAHYAFLWDGANFRISPVTALSANSYINMDISASNLGGALTFANALSRSYVYPLYNVYFNDNPLSDFKTTYFVRDTVNLTEDGGWMRSGSLKMLTRYKV